MDTRSTIDRAVETPAAAQDELSSARRAHGWRPLRSALGPLAGAALVLGAWELVIVGFQVPQYLAPSPVDTWRALVDNFSLLMQNAWPTLIESVAGFALGNSVAIALAIIFVYNRSLERTFYPVAVVIRTIPIVAIAPILVLLLGQGYAPKVVIAALISFFPTLVNMVRGLESVDKQALELMHVLSASRVETFFKLRLISSLPYLFAALKIATGSCVVGAVVAEWIGSSLGLGVLVVDATTNFRTPLLYATMAVASGMALVFFGLIILLEKLVVRWESDDVTA